VRGTNKRPYDTNVMRGFQLRPPDQARPESFTFHERGVREGHRGNLNHCQWKGAEGKQEQARKGRGERKPREFSLVDWILRFCGWKEEQPEEMFPPGLIHHRPDGPAPGDAPPRSGPGGGPSLVLTADPKPRLRWTADLHERFVDAVAQLGGPESERLLPAPRLFNLDALRFLSSALESNAFVGWYFRRFARWSSRGWIRALRGRLLLYCSGARVGCFDWGCLRRVLFFRKGYAEVIQQQQPILLVPSKLRYALLEILDCFPGQGRVPRDVIRAKCAAF
jgi:hypothetical protein